MVATKEERTKSFLVNTEVLRWLPLVVILCIASVLYFYQLGAESLWSDEFYSLYDARAVPQKISSTRPVYYILLRVWMIFGESDVWLRSLSIPFALGSVFLIYRLGERLFDRSIGLIGALMLTLSPVFINHAQEIRMYTVSTFLGLLGTLVFTSVLEKLTVASLAGWIVLRILATLTTPLNVLLLLPDGILLVWRLRKQRRLLMILGGVLLFVALLSLPWAIGFIGTSLTFFGTWVSDHPKPTLVNVLSRLTIFTAYWPLQSLESSISDKFYKLYTILVALVLGASIFLRRPKAGIVYLSAWVVLPASVLFAVSWLFAPVWLPRYLLTVVPYLLLLIAAGFIAIKEWQPKLAIVLAIVYFVAVGGGLEHYYTKAFRDDWRSAVQVINDSDQPNDTIALYTSAGRPFLFVDHYYDGTAPIHVVDAKDENATLPDFESRLWIVHKPNDPDSPEAQEFRRMIGDRYQIEETQVFKTETGWEEIIEVFLVTQEP